MKALLINDEMQATDLKVIVWLLSTVLLGIALSCILPDFNDQWLNRNKNRSQRSRVVSRRVVLRGRSRTLFSKTAKAY